MSISAQPHWRTIDFISDLHLQAREPATFQAWQHYMAHTPADAVFILGDLFEVWVGDDILDVADDEQAQFAQQCLQVIQLASAHSAIYFIHGNRDFLLGQRFANACGMTLLADPCVLDFDQQCWLLSHGDGLCLGDVPYQQFRQQVRTPAWRTQFLAQPLAQRQALARGLRAQSEAHKTSGQPYADVDTRAACDWLTTAHATTLIHGHTHQPARHAMNSGNDNSLSRWVLSDWDAQAKPPRLEVLRLRLGCEPQRLPA